MTSMKDIRTQILGEGSVNACSNVLHGELKSGSTLVLASSPWEKSKSPFPFIHVKNYSHAGRGGAGQGWAAGPAPRQVLALAETVRANTEGLFRVRLLAVRISCIGG